MRIFIQTVLCFLLIFAPGCTRQTDKSKPTSQEIALDEDTIIASHPDTVTIIREEPVESETVVRFKQCGLVNVQELSSDILVELKYATPDNFTGQIAYTDFTEAWLAKDAAERLVNVQGHLHKLHPGYKLLIYDAARPISVQRKLFDAVKGTPMSKYVASPTHSGLHNYGAAVDLTIVDSLGIPLDMGTSFDHLGREAHTDIELQLLSEGVLTREQIDNRRLLRTVMRKEGFRVLPHEWWHFNAYTLTKAKQELQLLDF